MYEADSRNGRPKQEVPAQGAAPAAPASSEDDKKTKKQLVDELASLRQRINDLEAFESERKAIAKELKGTRQRLQYLLAVSPAIIYTTKASGDYACTFVSENLRAIMGYGPQEMTTDPKGWPDHLHPDDASRAFGEMLPLINRGGGTVEYRFRHRDGHYIWIQDTFKVVYDDAGHPLELVGAWADITERKEAERHALEANAEIQETKRYLTRLIESSPDAIIATDKLGNVVLFNEGAETLLGYRASEVVGRPTAQLYENEDRSRELVLEMRKRGGTASGFESVLRAKDGQAVPVLVAASVLLDKEGQEAGMVGFATDLRTRKKEEEELRRAHDELEKHVEDRTTELKAARERLRYLMTVTPAIVYTNQANDYTCTFVSENVSRIMGFSAWEMLEDKDFWTVRLHPEDAKRVFGEMGPLIEQGSGTIEYRFRHRDGHYIWIQDTFRVMRDDQGNPLEIVGSWADISGRKQAENALGERMAVMNDLETLVGASPAIIYTTQVTGDYACTFVSDNLDSIMGYAPWEMRDDKKFWLKRLHPDDANRVFSEMDGLIRQGGGALEYRFRHRDGHYIWIQDTLTVAHDDAGNPREIVGSWADVTDRKRVEAELQHMAEQVELRNKFIRETFGKYLTDEVVSTVLESPAGLADRRREAQDHHDDDRPARLHLAVGAAAAGTRGGDCSIAISPPWSRSSSSIRAPSTSSLAMRSSFCSGLRSGRRTTPNARSPAPLPCSSPCPRSTSRTGKKTCPSSRWASAFIPARWWWAISARPSA